MFSQSSSLWLDAELARMKREQMMEDARIQRLFAKSKPPRPKRRMRLALRINSPLIALRLWPRQK